MPTVALQSFPNPITADKPRPCCHLVSSWLLIPLPSASVTLSMQTQSHDVETPPPPPCRLVGARNSFDPGDKDSSFPLQDPTTLSWCCYANNALPWRPNIWAPCCHGPWNLPLKSIRHLRQRWRCLSAWSLSIALSFPSFGSVSIPSQPRVVTPPWVPASVPYLHWLRYTQSSVLLLY